MPEIKNTFLKSRMNKDLDSRIIGYGEYRDAQNASVSASEDASVGSLENIRGNQLLSFFNISDNNIEIIGQYSDTANNKGYGRVYSPGGKLPDIVGTNLTDTNYIGTSSADYADGEAATIQTVGSVSEDQSGLTAGLAYYVQPDGSLGISGDVFAGTAISPTNLIVKG